MRLVPFEPHMALDLARCYNDLVAPMPYSRPVPEAWFADLTPSQWQRGCRGPPCRVRSPRREV